ncbi:MAG: hypothetical protein QM755_00455 [Luteolibacter sp.]
MMLSDSELEELIRRAAPQDLPARLGRLLARLIRPLPVRPELAWAGAALVTLSLVALVLFLYSTSARGTSSARPPDLPKPETVPVNHVDTPATYQPCRTITPL